MSEVLELSVDYLVKTYGCDKNTIQNELDNWISQGLFKPECLDYLQARLEGEVCFSLEDYPFELAPMEAVVYEDYFYLSLRVLCEHFSIQETQVKLAKNRGMSLESAIEHVRKKTHKIYSKPKAGTDKMDRYLKSLGLTNRVKEYLKTYNLDISQMVAESSKVGIDVNTFIEKLVAQIEEIRQYKGVSYFGEIPENLQTTRSLEFEKLSKSINTKSKSTRTTFSFLRNSKVYNYHTIRNDSDSNNMLLHDFIYAIIEANLTDLYMHEELQPPFFHKGVRYPNFESFAKTNRYEIIDLRLRLLATGGNIDEALKTAKIRSTIEKPMFYNNKWYPSISALSQAFNLPYSSLTKKIKGCFLPNAVRTVDDVVDELIFNSKNNYITINEERVFLHIDGIKYKNVSDLCTRKNLDRALLMKNLKQDKTLKEACLLSKKVT